MVDADLDLYTAYQHALQASEVRVRALIENNADGLIIVDSNGAIQFMNPAAIDLFGTSAPVSLGTTFGIPLVANERTEIDIFRVDGTHLIAEMRVSETEWEGEPSFLASLRDISERKRLEDELRRRVEALAESDRRKDQFLATLAHELRNPLAPLRNILQLMRLSDHDPELMKQFQEMMERQVNYLIRIVDDLMEVSRITRGKIELKPQIVALGDILSEAVEANRALLTASHHELVFHSPSDPLPLHVDLVRMVQVFANLLNNAAKYTGAGGKIEISVRRDGDWAEISIKDNGIGISPHELKHVFEVFTQLNASQRNDPGGLGIGLTLVRALVELHGGTVTAHSAGSNLGSEFIVRLPLAYSSTGSVHERIATGQQDPVPLQCRVMIVDDNRDAADSLALLLRRDGASTSVHYDGKDALEKLPEFLPQAVLLDLGMPGLSGLEVAKRIRQLGLVVQPRLIAMTGWGQHHDRERTREAGFDYHFVKPMEYRVLASVLSDL